MVISHVIDEEVAGQYNDESSESGVHPHWISVEFAEQNSETSRS